MMRISSAAVAGWLALAAAAVAGQPGTFEVLGVNRGLGSLVASTVGPGATEGSQRFYLSYLYLNKTIDVVAVDPATGDFQVFKNPAPSEYGARTMVAGPDGKIYLGTLPAAHILCLDPKAGTLADLGRPSSTEQYIWDLGFGADGKLYGATYPQSKLVRYDPASGVLEDLGRMDPTEQYAHYVAGSNDGFVYTGIGTSKANIAAYEIATGQHREILPTAYQVVGQAFVYRGQDGKTYGSLGSWYFRLDGWTATPISASQAAPQEVRNRLSDGRLVTVSDTSVMVTDPQTGAVARRTFNYRGNQLSIFRVGFGPDGALYASTVLPIHLLRWDPFAASFLQLGDLGGGEIYSFLTRGDQLLLGAYSGLAPLMSYSPAQPFQPGTTGLINPYLMNYVGADSSWRPQAMINGPDGAVYLGAVSGYGLLGGPLTMWDIDWGRVSTYTNLVQDESVVSLAVFDRMIVGGTTISGGGGSHPTQTSAKLFLYDVDSRSKKFETVPVAGAGTIDDLIVAPNRLVYGIAGSKLFVFDPVARQVVDTRSLPFSGTAYNSVTIAADGHIWGLATAGVFMIDPSTNVATLVAKSPASVTAGFAVDETGIYYASDATLYRYNFPFVTWPSISGSGLPPNRHGPRGLRGDQGPTDRKNLSNQP